MNLTPENNLTTANQVLASTIQTIEDFAIEVNIENFDFWELINWLFVSHYWLVLLDFGQLSPTIFLYNENGVLINDDPVRYPSTYNIFVNETLFKIYSAYLLKVIIPLFRYTFPEFNSLNDINRINGSDVSLEMLYSCTDLQLKSMGNLAISVIVADWAFISSFYTLILLVGGWMEERKNPGD